MPRDVSVDQDHLLVDLTRMYDTSTEMLISESLGNAVDAGATALDITITKVGGEPSISFKNNGPPMTKSDMENYNVIARSSKQFGKSLGWAGIGSKLYLGYYKAGRIITTTGNDKSALQSEMWFEGKRLKWDFFPTKEKISGTCYKVLLKDADFEFLLKNAGEMIIKFFNTAMLNGLDITINGKKLEPWQPVTYKSFEKIIKIKKRKLHLKIFITDVDIPNERCWFEYSISGKKIVIRRPENLVAKIKDEFKRRFFVVVNAIDVSDQLQTNKHGFRSGVFTRDVEPQVEKLVTKVLDELGFIEDVKDAKKLRNSWSQAIQDVIADKFADLIRDGKFGFGKSGRQRGEGQNPENTEPAEPTSDIKIDAEEKEPKDPNNRGGLSFTTVIRPEDKRQSWFDPPTGEIVINLGHPVSEVIVTTAEGTEYHLNRCVSNELQRLAVSIGKYSFYQVLAIQNILFEAMLDARKSIKAKTKKRFHAVKRKRSQTGRFVKGNNDE